MTRILRPIRTPLSLLVATLAVACGGEDLVLPQEGAPASIVVVDGNDQDGTVGAALAAPVIVRVLDGAGRPVRDQQVTFTIVTGGGSVSPPAATTNESGEVAVSWTLGGAAGVQQVVAEASGGAAPDGLSVMVSATAGASAASAIEMVSGNEQIATAGSALDDSLIVRTTDAEGNPVAGVIVAWTIGGGGAVSEPTTTTGVDGRTGVRRTLGPTAGPQTTTATVAGLQGSPVAFTATATVGSAGKLVVVRQPSTTAQSGAAFATQPTVQVQDANDNDVAGAGRAISAELVSGPAGSTLLGNTTVGTNAAGLAVFTNLGITGPAGSYTLNFTGADLTGVTSGTITLTAGAAARLAFSVQPPDGTAGAALSPAVRVTVQDALGQTVTGATTAITLALASNPGGGTLGGTRTVNAVNGVATFGDLSIDRAGAGYTLAASAPGLSGAVSAAFDIAAAGASGISANVTVPASTAPGGTVSPTPSVKVTDAGGNPVAGVSVTFTPLDGSSATGTSQITSVQGIATVGSWTIGAAAGQTYRLRATADGVGGEVIFSTTASGGLAVLTQPSATVESGQVFPQQPVIQLRDGSGAPVALAGVEVVATISSGGGTLGGTTTAVTDAAGQATFANLSISGSPGTRRLLFAASGFTAVTSAEIAVTAPAVSEAQSSFTADPAAVTVGVASTLTVILRDQSGAAVPGVTISLASDAAGTFGSAALTSGSNGTATTTYTPGAEGTHTLTASAQAAGLTTTVAASAAGG